MVALRHAAAPRSRVRAGFAAPLVVAAALAACGDTARDDDASAAPRDGAPARAPSAVEPAAAPSAADGPTRPAPGDVLSTPLVPRQPSGVATLFERLPSTRTGIDFRHAWTDDPAYLHVLGNAMAGGGAAAGDYDGDGRADVVLTRPVGGTRLYGNRGDFVFDDVTDASGLGADAGWGTGAVFADVDDDGRLDLAVCGYDHPNRLWMNGADGVLRDEAAARGLAFHGASITHAFADFDLDGDLDAYLLTNRFSPNDVPDRPVPMRDGRPVIPDDLVEQFDLLADPAGVVRVVTAGQFDRLYRNDGTGAFADVTEGSGVHGNHFGLSATVFDADGDLWPDLYVANDFFGPDRLYVNQRDGTFADTAPEALPRTPWFSMGSDAGDVDNDGRLDLFASDMAATSHARRMEAMGDVWDVRWFLRATRPHQEVRNALLLNTGTGRFLEAAHFAGLVASDWTWSTLFGDLDADGRLDLYVSNGMSRDYFNTDLRRAAAGHAAEYMRDFWAGQPPLRDTNLAFRNGGGLRFDSVGPAWGLDQAAASFGATLADLDGDGDLDVLVNNFDEEASVFRNGSVDGHVLAVRLLGTHGTRDGIGAQVTITTPADDPDASLSGMQMRDMSLARGYMAGVEARAHFGLGAHDAADTLTVRWPSGHVQTFRDLPAGHLHTVAEPSAPPPARAEPVRPTPLFALHDGPVSHETPYDDGRRQPLLPWSLSTLGPGLALGDMDGDGHDDLWLGGPAGQPGVVLRNDAGRLAPVPQPVLGLDDYYEDLGGVLFDADANGHLDLYVASGGSESPAGSGALRDRLYLGAGDGTFTRAPKEALPDVRTSSGPVAAADVDGDGRLDLFVGGRNVPGAYPQAPPSRLLRNTGGAFLDASADLAPSLADVGMVSGATFADLDDDGFLDLALAVEWGPVRLLRGTSDGFLDATAAAGLAGRTGLWRGVLAGDVDGDGDLDLVVTNLGTNTPHRAADDAPFVLYHGDVDGSGTHHLVEATWDGGVEVPVRCLDCLRDAMPVLGHAQPSYAAYGRASLADVYGADVLASVPRLSCNELRAGVLLNDGRGAFAFRPLPAAAQLAPSQGAALLDANGDGAMDLVLSQNFSGAHAEAGRWNGGLGVLLLGDGRGGFRAAPADASGIVIPDDGRGVALTDLDGDGRADVFVACSDGPLRMLVGRDARAAAGAGGEPSLVVRLAGTAGNATAVGARVTVRLADGGVRVAEVNAGGGYLSQSSATLHFGVTRDAVRGITVRWPTGASSEHAGPGAGRGTVVLRHP